MICSSATACGAKQYRQAISDYTLCDFNLTDDECVSSEQFHLIKAQQMYMRTRGSMTVKVLRHFMADETLGYNYVTTICKTRI